MNIQKVKKKAAVFILRHSSTEKHPLIKKTACYFEREIDGQRVMREEWRDLVRDLNLALDQDLALALDLGLALDLARDLDRPLDQALARVLARDQALDLALARSLDLVVFLLVELGHWAPRLENLNTRIKNDFEKNACSLEMGSLHDSEFNITHCASGFMEIYAGSRGAELVEHFGHWITGAMIDLKSTGSIRDFYASNEDAWEYICEGAKKEASI